MLRLVLEYEERRNSLADQLVEVRTERDEAVRVEQVKKIPENETIFTF